MLGAGVILARLVVMEWWQHDDVDGLQMAGTAFVIWRLVYTVWQSFSTIVAMETELTKCQIDLELLAKSDADEEKPPPILPNLLNVTESASLAASRATVEDELGSDERKRKELGARFSPFDVVRLSSTLKGTETELHKFVPDVSLLIVALLAFASVALGVRYLARFPELTMSMTNARIIPRFSPETREYDLLLDSGQPELELFLQCDPERVAQLEVHWPGRPALLENKTCSLLNATATHNLFPAVVDSAVDGGLWRTSYTFWVRPIRVLAKSLVLRGAAGGADFSRCIHWGEIPGTSISLPQNVSDLSLELATHAYEIELPVDLRNQTSLPKDPKTFFTGFLELAADRCAEHCRDHPHCATRLAVNAGCYVVVGAGSIT